MGVWTRDGRQRRQSLGEVSLDRSFKVALEASQRKGAEGDRGEDLGDKTSTGRAGTARLCFAVISRKWSQKTKWGDLGNNCNLPSPVSMATYLPSLRSSPSRSAALHAAPCGLGSLTTSPLVPCSHEKLDSENIPPSKHHQPSHNSLSKPEPEAKTRGEGDGRGCEKAERRPERPEVKSEPLVKANGVQAGLEPASEPGSPYPEGPRVPGGREQPAQPNGWQCGSPGRPGSTAFPPPESESGGHQRGVLPRANPDKIAQRKSSMDQLQQWVNLRRGAPPPEDLRR